MGGGSAGVLLGGLAALGCATPTFRVSDLPGAPIAVVYRTVEETNHVAEAMAQQAKDAASARAGRFDIDMGKVEQLAGWRGSDDLLHDQLGRMAFYAAPTGRLEVAAFAQRGSHPLEWSADRKRLLYASPSGNNLQLFEWVAGSGEVRQLTRGPGSHYDGCFGPDGALAYVEVESLPGGASRSRIWVQRPGEEARAVTPGPADGAPAWSPDGRRLVYTTYERDEWLHWLDPETGDGGVLTRGRSPTFTPDGAWLVYSGPTREGWKLWRMRADGSVKRRFGASAFLENDPSVSPDGRFVVFAGTKEERSAVSRLFVRPLDGSPDRQLGLAGSALLPVW